MSDSNFGDEFFHEINIVQNIINRMAQNSFIIKGWTVTLVVIALLVEGQEIHYSLAYLPCIVFWTLDAYYLRQERLYRKLYEWIIENRPENKDNMFDMRLLERVSEVPYFSVLISTTISLFYGMVFILIWLINSFFNTI